MGVHDALRPQTLADGTVPTKNKMGFMMATTTPLLGEWLAGATCAPELPVVDVGCAYGINCVAAARRGLRVVGVDMTREHLDEAEQVASEAGVSKLISFRLGSLPGGLDEALPGEGVASSILVAEVLHFLDGARIEESLAALFRKLAPGGRLVVTVISAKLLRGICEPDVQARLDACDPRSAWPYEMPDWASLCGPKQLNPSAPEHAKPDYLHFVSADKFASALALAGFEVFFSREGVHDGYPGALRKLAGGFHVQAVAIKPKHLA
jgi:SAM-dependent methyltransferase